MNGHIVARLAMAAVVVSCISGCGASVPRSSSSTPGAASATTSGPHTVQPPTSTTGSRPTTTVFSFADPQATAETISLEPSDIGDSTEEATPASDASHNADPCAVVSHSPFLADHVSPGLSTKSDTPLVLTSQVAVEPTTAAAEAVVTRMSSSDWAHSCDLKNEIANMQRALDESNTDSPCDESMSRPTETASKASMLVDGVVGWQYSATVHCGLNDTDSPNFDDTLITHVGPVVIVLFVRGIGIKPTEVDFHTISSLIERAKAAEQE